MKYNSDLIMLYDAKDTNPNGNPLSGDNKPRRDSATGLAEVSSGRVKRYIRDQMFDEGHPIFVVNSQQYESDTVKTPSERAEELVDELGEPESEEEAEEIFKQILYDILDIRYFGSALALDNEFDISSVTGPVQLQPGRSLHKTKMNNELAHITGSLSTGDGSGGSMGTDYRLHYALFGVCGTINSSVAENTGFAAEDEDELDKLFWKSLVHQTHSNSKSGQKPRLYIRVKYDTEFYQIRNLDEFIEFTSEMDEMEVRSVSDYSLDITRLVDKLETESDHIGTVQIIEDEMLKTEYDGKLTSVKTALSQKDIDVEEISVYE